MSPGLQEAHRISLGLSTGKCGLEEANGKHAPAQWKKMSGCAWVFWVGFVLVVIGWLFGRQFKHQVSAACLLRCCF